MFLILSGYNEGQMVTRSQIGTYKPNPEYALTALYSSLDEPQNLNKVLKHPCQLEAMHSELP